MAVVSGSGRIQPKTKVNITSEVNAVIIGIPVKEGDFVDPGAGVAATGYGSVENGHGIGPLQLSMS